MRVDLSSYWYRSSLHPLTIILLPFSWLFQLITSVRRKCYQLGIFKIQRVNKPVIVVGNITVGGTGKTPFVIWLAHYLQTLGYHPGIVTRGVGGKKQRLPLLVDVNSNAVEVGDEALLLAKKSNCPVMVGIDRPLVAKKIIENHHCDIVISDDGLQHYRLGRDIEVALVDGARQFGNRQLLPAGPLREKISRLNEVDFVIVNSDSKSDQIRMSLEPVEFVSIINEENKLPLNAFAKKTIHAVAAIGNPQQFFLKLKNLGLHIVTHEFPDHHLYSASDFNFTESYPVIMTEKDAVKCQSFADERFWYLRVNTIVSEELKLLLVEKLRGK